MQYFDHVWAIKGNLIVQLVSTIIGISYYFFQCISNVKKNIYFDDKRVGNKRKSTLSLSVHSWNNLVVLKKKHCDNYNQTMYIANKDEIKFLQ